MRGPLRRLRLPRWLLPLVVLGAVGFLYVRPITTYLETRDQLDERRSEVAGLRAERARVTARLERATSLEELARAARRIGYVRPERAPLHREGDCRLGAQARRLTPAPVRAPAGINHLTSEAWTIGPSSRSSSGASPVPSGAWPRGAPGDARQ